MPSKELVLYMSWVRTYVLKKFSFESVRRRMLDALAVLTRGTDTQRLMQARVNLGLYHLAYLPYWQRMWTFQEFVLPREQPLCMLAGMKRPFLVTQFSDPEIFSNPGFLPDPSAEDSRPNILPRWLIRQVSPEIDRKLRPAYEQGMKSTNGIKTNGLRMISPTRWRTLYRPEPTKYIQSSIVEYLHFTAHRHCSDPRDKIFALRGLVPASQDIYPLDYAKPVESLMLKISTYLVNQERGIPVLEDFALHGDEPLPDPKYPSWVPKFELPTMDTIRLENYLIGSGHLLNAHNDVPDARATVSDLGILCLRGRRLGTVVMSMRFQSSLLDLALQIAALIEHEMHAIPAYMVGGWLQSHAARVLSLCNAFIPVGVTQADLYGLVSWAIREIFPEGIPSDDELGTYPVDIPSDDELLEKEWKYIVKLIGNKLQGKVFFSTDTGCYGIGTGSFQVGDIVVLSPGLELPFILTRDPSADGQASYRYAGKAILDRISGGESQDEELISRLAERELEEFTIH
ncbi:hypothetical protein F4778DRAFT_130275 [Xylariomycetidae sp. FL2044]|nr:hypothetical protein F4778DRAFT_130275 [Xylariomycetidae sp. FL2044]